MRVSTGHRDSPASGAGWLFSEYFVPYSSLKRNGISGSQDLAFGRGLEGLLKHRSPGLTPESDVVGLGCAGSCVSNRFPGAAAAWGPHEVWEEASLRERVKKVVYYV